MVSTDRLPDRALSASDIDRQIENSFNHIAVTEFGTENVRRVQVSDICTINLENIDNDIKHNVKEFVWWAQAHAQATKELSNLYQEKDDAKAELRREEARLRLMAYSPQGLHATDPAARVNESTVEAWIEVHPLFQKLQANVSAINKRIYEKEHTVNTMSNMREGFKMKAKLLTGLCARKAGGSASDVLSKDDLES